MATTPLPAKSGQTVDITQGDRAIRVKMRTRGSYVAWHTDGTNRNRTRWGNAKEMTEDIATFHIYGRLPQETASRPW